VRDNFTPATKAKLARRAGHRCSKPDCQRPTGGAASDDEGTINIGVAAHIKAAAPNGPRSDPSLAPEQRKHHSNGIWLCATHAKLVDSDESHFTVEVLLSWKKEAADRSFAAVVASGAKSTFCSETDVKEGPSVVDRILESARADLSAFQSLPGWPPHALSLHLTLVDKKRKQVFTASGLVSAIEVFDEIGVIAAPGTGKTTTLLQLVEAILDAGSLVALFVPLSEWSTSSDSFFQTIARRNPYRGIGEDQFGLLAEHGRLVMVLDGWNELDESSKKHARNHVKALRRDFPGIRFVISSRFKEFDLPIDGPNVEIGLLTEEQQMELADSLRGTEGQSLVDHAWRTPGLRELVAIPLYLSVLLEHAPTGSLPKTKEAVLRLFVTEHEKHPDKTATLRQELLGFHREMLFALAAEATSQTTTTLSDSDARAVVNRVQKRLRANGQLGQLFQPTNVLGTLVNVHMLVRSGAESGGISFQHQQFQEWYASFRVEELMVSAFSADTKAAGTLKAQILDIPVWEEAILFACDRLSRAGEQCVEVVSCTILETLGIDPLLSAEMIHRSSEDVWQRVKAEIVDFAQTWHTDGKVDHAVQFMINTGRPEFAPAIWPLVSDPDSQIHLHALRAGRRFRPCVLGPGVKDRIAALPEELREHIVSEIAGESGMDGIELATSLAKNDPSPKVQVSVIGSLQFRYAERFARQILESAPDDVWKALAGKWRPGEFSDPWITARLQKEVERSFTEESDPREILHTLLSPNSRSPETGVRVQELIENIDFSEKKDRDPWSLHSACELYPDYVVKALVSQLERGSSLPFGMDEYLRGSSVSLDEGPLVDLVLQDTEDGKDIETIVTLFGPATVSRLIDRLLDSERRRRAQTGPYDKALSDECHRLSRWISRTKPDSFVRAIVERSGTEHPDEIATLADLVSRHGGSVERSHLEFKAPFGEELTGMLQHWGEILLASPDATRAQFAEIAQAAERLGSLSLVPLLQDLLTEDLARRKQAKKDYAKARQKGRHIDNDACMSWTLQYRRTFAAIGGDETVQIMKSYLTSPEFGVDAALVLKAVWKSSQAPEDEENKFPRSWPDFSEAAEQYAKRQSGQLQETQPFVDDILAVVTDLIRPGSGDEAHRHTLGLAAVALCMPYSDKADLIETLLALPLPPISKQDLLAVLVMAGEIVPSGLVVEGINNLLEEAKSKPWMLEEQDGWRLNAWLKLMPFTDKPSALLDVFDRIDGRYLQSRNLRGLLLALSYSPFAEAEQILEALAKRDERFLTEHDWLNALTIRRTLSGARSLLDLICDSLTPENGHRNRLDFGKRLSGLMTKHAEFRDQIYQRFQELPPGPAKSVLEYAIADSADTQGVMLLAQEAAIQGKALRETGLYTALRHVLVGQRPALESSGMQELFSLPSPELRRELFGLVVNGDAAQSRVASECLTAIDQIRDDFGNVESEPRHPDITLGVPWPLLDSEKASRRTE